MRQSEKNLVNTLWIDCGLFKMLCFMLYCFFFYYFTVYIKHLSTCGRFQGGKNKFSPWWRIKQVNNPNNKHISEKDGEGMSSSL